MSSLLTSRETTDTARREGLSKRLAPDPQPGFRYHRPTGWQRFCRVQLFRRLARLQVGHLLVCDGGGCHTFGSDADPTLHGGIEVHHPRFFSRLVRGGALGAAESYMDGDWTCRDLVATLRLFARNKDVLTSVDRWGSRLMRPARSLWMWMHRNHRAGSRRNIAAHYDLSNEFFALMLDPTMTYSSGFFEQDGATLQEASVAKYDRICRKLDLKPEDHVLEVGTGWGGFAIHAARNYGCRVTTTTISRQQHVLAGQRVREAGVQDRVELLLKDYRDLDGQYDKAVSIEMIEAVGERMFDTYFRQCNRLLKPNGAFLLQAITMPDHRYDHYRRRVDFINRYIFPGGFLPSISAIGQSLRRATDFRVAHLEDFGTDYAKTLSGWRANFWDRIDRVRELGFDDRFVRMWHYYLCYCEAGFAENEIGVSQIMLTRPACQLTWRR